MPLHTPPSTDADEAYVRAAAQALGLPIAAEWQAGVVGYFRLARQMAAVVMAVPLGAADESHSVFRPVAPEGRD